MTEWGVFGVIASIVALFLSVGVPALRLNATITRLSVVLEVLESKVECDRKNNEEEHVSLWNEIDKQEETVQDHEVRLTVIEKGGNK